MKIEHSDFWDELLLSFLRGLSNGLTYAILAVALFTAAIFCSAATPPTLADITLPAGVTTNATFTGTGYGVYRLNVSAANSTLRNSSVLVSTPTAAAALIAINIQPAATLVMDHTTISNDSWQNAVGVQGLAGSALEIRNGSVITAGRGLSIARSSRVLVDASTVTATNASGLGAIYAFGDDIDISITNGSTVRAGANGRAIYSDSGSLVVRIENSTVDGSIIASRSIVGSTPMVTNATVAISGSVVSGLTAEPGATMSARVMNGSAITSSLAGSGLSVSFETASRFEGVALGVGQLSFDASSRWELPSNSRVGTLSLAGRINFPATPTALVVDDLVGNGGIISISAPLKGDETPISRIFVTKSATGLTHLRITNAGGSGSLTERGIKIVDYMSTAQISSGTFDMPAGPVVVGPFSYALKQLQDGDYYLISEVVPAARLPAVTLFAQQDLAMRTLGSHSERPRNGAWTTGQASNIWNDTGDGLRTHVTTQTLRAGSSLATWRALDFGAAAGINDLAAAGVDGRIDLSSFEAVLTASSSRDWGFMEFSVGGQRLRHTTYVLGNTLRSQGWNFLGAFETGRSWHWKSISVTPSVQAIGQTGNLDRAQGTTLRARYGSANLLTIKGAVNVAFKPRAACLLWVGVGGNSRSDASTAAHLSYQGGEEFRVASAMAGLVAEVESGFDLRVTDRLHLHGAARYRAGARSHGFLGVLGLRRDFQ